MGKYPIFTLYQHIIKNGALSGVAPVVIDHKNNGLVFIDSAHSMLHQKKLFSWSHTVTLSSSGDLAHFFIEPSETYDMHVIRGTMVFEKKATFTVYRNPTGLPTRTNLDASGICSVFEASGNNTPNGTIKYSATPPSDYGDLSYKIKEYDKKTTTAALRDNEEIVVDPGAVGLFVIQSQDVSNEVTINIRAYEIQE